MRQEAHFVVQPSHAIRSQMGDVEESYDRGPGVHSCPLPCAPLPKATSAVSVRSGPGLPPEQSTPPLGLTSPVSEVWSLQALLHHLRAIEKQGLSPTQTHGARTSLFTIPESSSLHDPRPPGCTLKFGKADLDACFYESDHGLQRNRMWAPFP